MTSNELIKQTMRVAWLLPVGAASLTLWTARLPPAPIASCRLAGSTYAPRRRAAAVFSSLQGEDVAIDGAINELLAEERQEELPALLGRRLDVLTDARFLPRLEERRLASSEDGEGEALAQLADLVVTFVEEVTQQLKELEPAVAAAQAEANKVTSEAAATAVRRRPAGATAAPAKLPVADDDVDSQVRERRAKYRFLVERLLDAAKMGTERLDDLLRAQRSLLDRGFFDHMQWEVEEQRKARNRRMLEILEVVVQRACLEVEGGEFEVALLGALLQTRNPDARREMYERELRAAEARTQVAFKQLVLDTQLELEKAVLRGETVDQSLLQMLRVIGVEASELRWSGNDDDGDDSLGI